MDWYTVIPTYNRPAELGRLIETLIVNQVGGRDKILVINNGGPVGLYVKDHATVIEDRNPGPHIYEMWNVGLSWADRMATVPSNPGVAKPHAVAILNDDVELPPNFAARMIECLRDTDATITFPDQGPGIINQQPIAGHRNAPNNVMPQKRITGYAFVVNGTHGIRCDESFKWWYGDDDLDWQARQDYNGTWEVDVTVKHTHPGESTNARPDLIEQADRDRKTFVQKWGKAPW